MGRTVNPGNDGFAKMLATKYVDKTGLIGEFDSTLDTTDCLVLSTRPRRFGKSFSALSLVAFYSCGCDSRGLFEGLKVSMRQGWDAHLNAYNVVQLDITGVVDGAKFKAEKINEKAGTGNAANKVAWQSLVVPTATEWIREGLCEIVPDAGVRTGSVDVTLTNGTWTW